MGVCKYERGRARKAKIDQFIQNAKTFTVTYKQQQVSISSLNSKTVSDSV